MTRPDSLLAVLVAALAALAVSAAGTAGASSPPAAGLAFDRGAANLTVWAASDAGVGAHRLGPGGQPLISPSGAYVAVNTIAATGPAIVVYGSSGGRHGFFDARTVTATPLAWSSDSRYLIASVTVGTTSTRGDGLDLIDTSDWSVRTVARGVIATASFDPRDPTRFVYDLTSGVSVTSPIDLWAGSVSGGRATRLTRDGRSLDPLWTQQGIVYDHERLRGQEAYPEYQLWLLRGGRARQLTRVRVPALQSGLVPIAADADGNRLIANFEGEDSSYAVDVQIAPLRIHTVDVGRAYPVGAGISRDGATVLLDVGSFEQPASDGTVDTQPFFGGRAHVLTRGGDASWDG